MYYVYELVDPRDSLPFYIGITNNPKLRFYHHTIDKDTNPAKYLRIQQIRSLGLEPIMNILETAFTRELAEGRERYWILECLSQDIPLTNIKIVAGQQIEKEAWDGCYYPEENYADPSYLEEGWETIQAETGYPLGRGLLILLESFYFAQSTLGLDETSALHLINWFNSKYLALKLQPGR